jgi:hypothetical protein
MIDVFKNKRLFKIGLTPLVRLEGYLLFYLGNELQSKIIVIN